LAGLGFFKEFVHMAQERANCARMSFCLQTNGILLDDEWAEFLKANDFLVGLSIDGEAATHNTRRLDASGSGSFQKAISAKRLLDKREVSYNILAVLTQSSARHAGRAWRFIMAEGIRYIQFIPCLGELGSPGAPWELTPNRFHSFYSSLFPFWKREALSGNYISIKLFDDIANLFLYGEETACGITGRCFPQYIIEADGSAFPCDFYALDTCKTGNAAHMTIREIFDNAIKSGFLEDRPPLPEACGVCPYFKACGGGCKRMTLVDETGFCGYRRLLDDILDDLIKVAQFLSMQR
jgi:uncharacterized protein